MKAIQIYFVTYF